MPTEETTPFADSRLFRLLLSGFLRIGRLTKYSPSWKGYNRLQRLYQRWIPTDFRSRIYDFDGDLLLDVNVRANTDLSLWHFPNLYEPEEQHAFCSAISPGCAVLDVGANIGMYTLLAAKRGARVFSIEADPLNVVTLEHNVAINGFTERVTIFPFAVTDHNGPAPLYRHPYNLGQSNIVKEGEPAGVIEGRTIDSL